MFVHSNHSPTTCRKRQIAKILILFTPALPAASRCQSHMTSWRRRGRTAGPTGAWFEQGVPSSGMQPFLGKRHEKNSLWSCEKNNSLYGNGWKYRLFFAYDEKGQGLIVLWDDCETMICGKRTDQRWSDFKVSTLYYRHANWLVSGCISWRFYLVYRILSSS